MGAAEPSRQDREYREDAERRRLMLENLSLENRVLAERVCLAKELGATARLLNYFVFKPQERRDWPSRDHHLVRGALHILAETRRDGTALTRHNMGRMPADALVACGVGWHRIGFVPRFIHPHPRNTLRYSALRT